VDNKQSRNSEFSNNDNCSCECNDLDVILAKYNSDPTRLMDILIEVQTQCGYVSEKAVKVIAKAINYSKVDVEQTLSFYHFLSQTPTGKYAVYLNDSAVAGMMGRVEIAKAFEEEVGCKFGSVSEDGNIGLFSTSCIGMNDQEPSAIINQRVFTKLTKEKVAKIVKGMRTISKDYTIFKCSRFTFIRITEYIMFFTFCISTKIPFHGSWETCTTTTSKIRLLNFFNNIFRSHSNGFLYSISNY